jgi:phosphoribosylformimino-5-aminoimidazole carboxamide ribotide isomerase
MFPIPAIDIIDGKCVRLSQGDYQQKTVYHNDPLEVALKFEAHGVKRLHLVDLDGAREKKIINYKTLERIANATELLIDFGGGLQSDSDLKIAFESGAQQITGGSIAIKNPDLFLQWIQTFGAEKIILGADARDGKIAVSGWQEKTSVDAFDFIGSYLEKGIRYCISTDVSKDGMLQGPATEWYKDMLSQFPNLQLIASGGVSGLKDLESLAEIGVYGAIIGKAFYEGHIGLKDLENLVLNQK